MTTQTETLKLALELLAVSTFYSPELQAKRTEIIERGLEALAQQSNEQVEPVAINELMNIKDLEATACSDDAAYCLIAILERIGPDATVSDAITLIENISAHPPVPTAQPKEPEQSGFFSREAMKDHSDGHMAQPEQESDDLTIAYMCGVSRGKELAQRTWVGLTDEDIKNHYQNQEWLDGVRFAETVLKEKNQ